MRLCRLPGGSTGLITDPHGLDVVEIHASLPSFASSDATAAAALEPHFNGGEESWCGVIDNWDDLSGALSALEAWAAADPSRVRQVDPAELEAPLPDRASHIFAIGANFASHGARSQRVIEGDDLSTVEGRARALVAAKDSGTPPWGFNVLPGTVIGHEDAIRRPEGIVRFDYEGEVGAVLRTTPAGATSIWGVVPWNDVSIRDKYFGLGPRVDEGPLTWSLQKNFDCGNACGPWVTIDEAIDVDNIEIRLRVNGDERQRGSTDEMVYRFDEAIEHFGTWLTLRSGDMIASGTPAGTAIEEGDGGPYLADGDVVEVELVGIATLRNRVVPT